MKLQFRNESSVNICTIMFCCTKLRSALNKIKDDIPDRLQRSYSADVSSLRTLSNRVDHKRQTKETVSIYVGSVYCYFHCYLCYLYQKQNCMFCYSKHEPILQPVISLQTSHVYVCVFTNTSSISAKISKVC